jgi:outer membrane protein OmpA-like peptidoglycan-associated protein
MRFQDVPPPSTFGPQYLSYVVWAISPDGRAQNMGELALDGFGKGRLETSTPLQTFAMILTAEPYYSVTQPSEVVVMENVVGPGTIGKIEEVNATYELLPRKPFTFAPGSQPKVPTTEVSKEQYESITALYQALNAIQIAQSQGADRYAASHLARARELYNKARAYPVSLSKEIVSMARAATQIAEDSRAIAVKRAAAQKAADDEQSDKPAEATAPESEQTGRASAPVESEPARIPTTHAPEAPHATATPIEGTPPVQVDHSQFSRDNPQASDNRKRLLASLARTFDVIDSSRGVLITLQEQLAREQLQTYFAPLAAAIKPYQDIHIEAEGHTDLANSVALTEHEAERVRQALIGAGISPEIIVRRGYGNTRPRTSNATAAGRAQNRRIEIVIAGDAIGTLATWDRTYTLQPSPVRR